MNPPSAKAAGREACELFRRHFRGASSATKRRRRRTAALIASRIWCRWQVGVHRWRQKHVRWYLAHHLRDATNNTRYQHYLVLREVIRVLGHAQWLEHLDGPWLRPTDPSIRSVLPVEESGKRNLTTGPLRRRPVAENPKSSVSPTK